jgi:hypothetical protein
MHRQPRRAVSQDASTAKPKTTETGKRVDREGMQMIIDGIELRDRVARPAVMTDPRFCLRLSHKSRALERATTTIADATPTHTAARQINVSGAAWLDKSTTNDRRRGLMRQPSLDAVVPAGAPRTPARDEEEASADDLAHVSLLHPWQGSCDAGAIEFHARGNSRRPSSDGERAAALAGGAD